MSIISLIAAAVFIGGYVLIALENKIGLHKAAIAMLMGCVPAAVCGYAIWSCDHLGMGAALSDVRGGECDFCDR